MKKASVVLYVINAIFAIAAVVGLVVLAFSFKNGQFNLELEKAIAEINKTAETPFPYTAAEVAHGAFIGLLVLCIFDAVDALISILGAIIAAKKDGKGYHIFALVISIITGLQLLLFLASLFGILGARQQE